MDEMTTPGAGDDRQYARDVRHDAPESMLDSAREATRRTATRTKSFLREQIDRQTCSLGDRLSGTADDLQSVAAQLRERQSVGAASIASTAAERVREASSYLRRTDGARLIRDLESYARRQPWVIAGVGLLLGLAAARFLKSSGGRDDGWRYADTPDVRWAS